MALGNGLAIHRTKNINIKQEQITKATGTQKQALQKELTELKANHTKHVEAVQQNLKEQINQAQGEAKKELKKKQEEFKSKYVAEDNTEVKDNAEEEADAEENGDNHQGDGSSGTSEKETKECTQNIKSFIESKKYFLFKEFKMKNITILNSNIDTTCLTDQDKATSIKDWYDTYTEANINDANVVYNISLGSHSTKTNKCLKVVCEKIAKKITQDNISETITAENLEINEDNHKNCYQKVSNLITDHNFINIWNDKCAEMYIGEKLPHSFQSQQSTKLNE